MSDDEIRFCDEFDVEAAADTSMSDAEREDFRDHVAVVMTLQSAAKRYSIPKPLVEETIQHSVARMKAYIDAYDVEPALTENPVPRARDVLRQSKDHSSAYYYLSETEWREEKMMMRRAYADDEVYHFTASGRAGGDAE